MEELSLDQRILPARVVAIAARVEVARSKFPPERRKMAEAVQS